MIIIRRIEQSS